MVIRTTWVRGQIGPSLKGRFYSYRQGEREIVSSWPRPQKRQPTEDEAATRRLFKECCVAMKVMHPAFIAYAAEDSKGKPMLPRDALMAALYGKGPVFFLPDGTRRIPMATRIDMSTMMDNIAWEPGSLLYRDEDMWVGLAPPDEPSFLVFDPAQGFIWVSEPGGGGTKVWSNCNGRTARNANTTCKGVIFEPFEDITIDAVNFLAGFAAGNQYKWSIYEVGPTEIILSILGDGNLPIPSTSADRIFVGYLPAPLILLAGHRYMVCCRQPTAVATNNTEIRYGDRVPSPLALWPGFASFGIAKQNPVVGDQFVFHSSTQIYSAGVRSA